MQGPRVGAGGGELEQTMLHRCSSVCVSQEDGTEQRAGAGSCSAFAEANADHGGARRALRLAGWAPRGGLFQGGDDLRQGLQIPLTLQERDKR